MNEAKIIACIFIFCIILLIAFAQEKSHQSNKACSVDSDCKSNSYCQGNFDNQRGVCACNRDYIIPNKTGSHYECVKVAEKLGDGCKYDIQCQVALGIYSECHSNKCACNASAHYVAKEKSCFKSSRLNETCVSHDNCISDFSDVVYCTNGRCTCALQHHSTSDGRCIKHALLNDRCDDDASCAHIHAHCRDTCVCQQGYVADQDENNCIKVAKLIGEPCRQDNQCSYLPNTSCLSSQCLCRPSMHQYENVCIETRLLGEPCTDHRQCTRTPAMKSTISCRANICTCNDGYDAQDECTRDNNTSGMELKMIALLLSILAFIMI